MNKELVRNNLKNILQYYGARPGSNNWSCIPSRHSNPSNNLTVTKNNICACHCGLQGDSFNVIAEMEGLDIKSDFPKIIKIGLEILGSSSLPTEKPKPKQEKQYESFDFTRLIFKQYKEEINDHRYFLKRGISMEIIDRYKIVVGDPRKIIPEKFLPNIRNIESYENIIPVTENNKIVNCILRRNDEKSTDNNKIMNLSKVQLKIFNACKLKDNLKYIFVTEGIFDCLSFETIGLDSISINSVVMINKLVSLIDLYKCKNTKFIIAFDNDKSGIEAAKKLISQLKKRSLFCMALSFTKYKDINEYFIKDKENFARNINKMIRRMI
jgi:DNA primase